MTEIPSTITRLDHVVYMCTLVAMKIPSEKELRLLGLVSDRELSGREVAEFYQKVTGSSISYGTLYTTFRRMKESGWVVTRDDKDEDGRIRYFRLTGSGICALNNGRAHHRELSVVGLAIGGAV